MAMVAAGIANGGTLMRPYVVDEVRAPDLSVLDKSRPEAYRSNAVSSSVAHDLTQMMVEVVDQGTGTTAQIPGVSVAGKTGYGAELAGASAVRLVRVLRPGRQPPGRGRGGGRGRRRPANDITGGGLAAPIAQAVMEAVIGR